MKQHRCTKYSYKILIAVYNPSMMLRLAKLVSQEGMVREHRRLWGELPATKPNRKTKIIESLEEQITAREFRDGKSYPGVIQFD